MFYCNICSKRFIDLNDFLMHAGLKHFGSNNVTMNCPVRNCNKSYQLFKSFEKHVLGHLSDNENKKTNENHQKNFTYQCSKCKDQNSLLKGIYYHLQKGEKINCICRSKFVLDVNLYYY
jgi:hypothetical protein